MGAGLQSRLHAQNAHLELEFPFFLVKQAPVSRKPGVMDYTVRFDAAMLGSLVKSNAPTEYVERFLPTHRILYQAMMLRDYHWHDRDARRPIAGIWGNG